MYVAPLQHMGALWRVTWLFFLCPFRIKCLSKSMCLLRTSIWCVGACKHLCLSSQIGFCGPLALILWWLYLCKDILDHQLLLYLK